MTRLTAARLLESFFRRWRLSILPVVVLLLVGIWSVQGQAKTFRSVGSVNVASSTLVATLTDVRGGQSYGYDTPAGAMSKQLTSLLQTDQFVNDVASRAGLTAAVTNGALPISKIRGGLTAWANGPNLLMVADDFDQPEVAQRLAMSTIDAFVASIVSSNVGDSSAALSFFTTVLKGYQADVDTARHALDDWIKAHPAPKFGTARPDEEQIELKRLTDNLTQATDRYNSALSKSDSAQLSAEQAKSDVSQRLRIVDSPALPTSPQSGLKSRLLSMAIYLALGLLLTAAVVVMGALLDRTVRLSSDVKDDLGLRLLASVPDGGTVALAPTRDELLADGLRPPQPLATRQKPPPRPPARARATGSTRKPTGSRTGTRKASSKNDPARTVDGPSMRFDTDSIGAADLADADPAMSLTIEEALS